MAPDWVYALRDQCHACGVSFFFKQWGGIHKSEAGRKLEGRTHDDQPAIQDVEIPARRVRLQMLNDHAA